MAAAATEIMRAIDAVIKATMDLTLVLVEREREIELGADDLPAVLIYQQGEQTEAEFAGAADLRSVLAQVECIDAARHDDEPGDLVDRVRELEEMVRAALIEDRTLGGATLGVWVEAGGEARGKVGEQVAAHVHTATLSVRCAFV